MCGTGKGLTGFAAVVVLLSLLAGLAPAQPKTGQKVETKPKAEQKAVRF